MTEPRWMKPGHNIIASTILSLHKKTRGAAISYRETHWVNELEFAFEKMNKAFGRVGRPRPPRDQEENLHPLFDVVRKALDGDIFSMVEEGYEIDELKKELDRVAAQGSVDALLEWEEELWKRSSLAAAGYDEPSDWASIAKHFPPPDSHARPRHRARPGRQGARRLAGTYHRLPNADRTDAAEPALRGGAQHVHTAQQGQATEGEGGEGGRFGNLGKNND